MTSHQEDDWELDINLGLRLKNTLFQRRGVYSMEPDKELDLACERYKYPYQHYYSDDDDTNSSVTSGSILSEADKYSELDASLNDLDDFMYDEPPPPLNPKIIRTSALNYDFSGFPGVVQKLSTASRPQVQDNDDWNDDIDIPTKGILSLNHTEKIYDQQLSSLDDDDDNNDNESIPATTNKSIGSSSRAGGRLSKFHYAVEKDEDEDDMSGLDFPDNMGVLPKRLDEKKKYNPTTTSSSSSIPVKKLPVPVTKPAIKSKYLSFKETDDDDFCDGLLIKEKAFSSLKSSATSRSTQVGQRIKPKEPAQFVSRLARPSPLLSNSSKQSDHAIALSKKTQIPIKPKAPPTTPSTTTTTSRHTFLSGTKASRQREADIAANRSRVKSMIASPPSSLTLKKSLQKTSYGQESNQTERKSAVGYTLIAKPKTKKTTNYCSRLDNIDNLNDLPSKLPSYRKYVFQQPQPKIQHSTTSKVERKTVDPDRPWRRNMQTTSGGASNISSRVKLIQPNEQTLKKEYNDMRYDDSTHCWKGNETSLIDFQDKPTFRRPMLIMNKQQKNAPSRYAAVVGSSMIFNPELQKWVSANGVNSEHNELDTIEDLKEELLCSPATSCSRNVHRSANFSSSNKLREFEFSIERKRQIMAEQEEHERFMENWPIRSIPFNSF
ncbi:hypothetical protein BD770DRAFT_432269 [Pilaira anomala]|nr:hypothetical protein BD770DRAFT_432269 [Pilaira anomala]